MNNFIITIASIAVAALLVIPEDAEARRGGGRSRGGSSKYYAGSKSSTNVYLKASVGVKGSSGKSQQKDNIPPPPDGKYDPAPTTFTPHTCAALNLMAQTKEVREKCRKVGIFVN